MKSVFVLSGFAAFTLDDPGFLIPYFVKEGTDQAFVQELDDQFRVRHFQRFLVERHETASLKPEPLVRNVGDVGVMAFRFDGGAVVYDTPTKLRDELGGMDFKRDPFLAFDVFSFLRDYHGARQAIQAAGRTFKSADAGAAWTEIGMKLIDQEIPQNVIQRPYTSPPSLAAALITKLASSKAGEFILADLEELFHQNVQAVGLARARTLYWVQVVRSIVPLVAHKAATVGVVGSHMAYLLTKLFLGK